MIGVQTVPHWLCLTLDLAGGTVVEGCGTFWTWVELAGTGLSLSLLPGPQRCELVPCACTGVGPPSSHGCPALMNLPLQL